MGFYQDQIVPWWIYKAMRQRDRAPYRARAASLAVGRVLEIGIGPGLNLPFYPKSVKHIVGLDTSPRLLGHARSEAPQIPLPIEFVLGNAQAIPIEDRSIDTIVTTWTLCSIPDAEVALGEMRRVLRPSGRFVFVEHGRAPERYIRWLQDRLTVVWSQFSGGCHLNRAVVQLIGNAGFRIECLNTSYMRGPKLMTFMYEGCAMPR